MDKANLPKIMLKAKPDGLQFRAARSAMQKWDQTIESKKTDSIEGSIDILGEIGDPFWGGISDGMVKDALKAIGKGNITVNLNSPGGDYFMGASIYNMLREHPGKVHIKVLGLAASAASVVAMAGDTIQIGDGAMMMIHSAWGVIGGNKAELQKFAEILNAIDTAAAEIYAKRTKKPYAEVMKMMEAETWLTAAQSVEHGFADSLLPSDDKPSKARAAGNVKVFAHSLPRSAPGATGQARPGVQMSATTIPGATGSSIKLEGNQMNLAQQIAQFEAKRQASIGTLGTIMQKAMDEGRSLNEEEQVAYDAAKSDAEGCEKHVAQLKAHEKLMLSVAASTTTPADNGLSQRVNTESPAAPGRPANSNSNILFVAPNIEKGIPFTRYAKALCMAKGSPVGALAIAQHNRQWRDQTPQVEQVLMAAVAAGDTTTSGWASELVYNQNLVAEFIEYLRPQTILGKLTGLTKVPFNVRMSGQDSGSSANWVGAGKPIPVSKLHTLEVTLGIAKAAGLVVLTQELVRSSEPSAELLVRNDMGKAIATFLDVQFIAPDYAAVANVSPASVTNGVNPVAATGTASANLRADVQTLFGLWIAANLDPTGGAWVTTPTQALAISLMLNSLGQPLFPDVTMTGGTFFGLPMVVSNSAKQVGSPVSGEGNLLVLIAQPEVLLADDGQVVIDASAEAALEMLDNPTNASSGSTVATSMVSMFQTNSVALRATRFINWKKRRDTAVQYIKDAAYVA